MPAIPPPPSDRSSRLVRVEQMLRESGRMLELSLDPEEQRLARVVFKLAQRIGVDSGRLERAV